MHTLKLHLNILVLLISVLLAACRPANPQEVAPEGSFSSTGPPLTPLTVTNTLPPPLVWTPTKLATTTPAPTVTPTQSPAPSLTPTDTLTPDPYAGLSVPSLVARTYGGGEIRIVEELAVNSYFTRTLISFPSDGLTIYGFMNMPKRGDPPYPVVIASHGYINPEIYNTIDYTTRYADTLARQGFLVLHPNLRGYPPSDEGDNLFRVGMAVDVLNLIALVKEQAGKPGVLQYADPRAIGLWGHSMGGGISTRVMTVSPDVEAVVLYGAMSGDEQQNFERIFSYFSNGERGLEELAYPPEAFEVISPVNFIERVRAAVSIHHGENDAEVPIAWSLDLCRHLQELGKSVECFTYPGQPHTFIGGGDELFMQRMVDFFRRELDSR